MKKKNFLKEWFCYISDLGYHQWIAYGFIVFIWIINLANRAGEGADLPESFGVIDWGIVSIIALIIIHSILAAILKNKFITYPLSDDASDGYTFIRKDDGNFVQLECSIWGKTKRYSIDRAPYPKWSYANCLEDALEFEILIKGKYQNIHVEIPGTLFLKLNGKFDNLEVFNTLYKSQATGKEDDGHNFSLREYIIDSFEQANEPSQEEIDYVVRAFYEDRISSVGMLIRIQILVRLPEKTFSNVESAWIRLNDPEIYAQF